MAQLSRGGAGPLKHREYDGGSQLSQYQRSVLGDLGPNFAKLRKVRYASVLRAPSSVFGYD